LYGYGGGRFRSRRNFEIFFCFNRLVQTPLPLATFSNTASEFIQDCNSVVNDRD
jgi:hypothetical protein